MNRLLAAAMTALPPLLLAGCGLQSYEARLRATERRLRDEMTLDAQLAAPMEGAFRKNDIFLRVPNGQLVYKRRPQDPGVEDYQPVDGLPVGFFDVAASFPKQGETEQLPTEGFRLHVLARRDDQEQDQSDEPVPDAVAQRGDFRGDVRFVLENAYPSAADQINAASPEPVTKTIWPRSEPPRSREFERLKFTDLNNTLHHVYFFALEEGAATYDVALHWEFFGGEPPTGGTGPVDLTLGSFAVGRAANRAFSGDTTGEAAGGAEGGGGVAF